MLKKYYRLFLVAVILLALSYTFGFWDKPNDVKTKLTAYSTLYNDVEQGNIILLTQNENKPNYIQAEKKTGEKLVSVIPSNDRLQYDILNLAREKNIPIIVVPDKTNKNIWSVFLNILFVLSPVLLLIGFMYFMQQKQMKSLGGMKSFIKDQKKSNGILSPKDNPYRLKDVAGCDEIKHEVAEVVDFLKNAEHYQRVNARTPHGILMCGSPGTGKTLLAKAIAGESGVPFYSTSGSDFVEMFVGVGASRVRSLFEEAKKNAPSIIFIDEIDAIGKSRSNNTMGGNDERENTLNALLVEMDGFTSQSNVVVIAATNRSDVLDPALTRPGRFDREVTLVLPDLLSRASILKVHGQNIPVANDVDWTDIARGTPGFSGAELSNLVNEAAVLAAREKETLVHKHHFEEAHDKIVMGVQRGSLKNDTERKIVAYHEAGHALVAHFTDHTEPVHKISIMPRGRALGVTVQLPKEDSYNHSKKKLLANISVLMGGRAAEDVALQEQTVGASNDFIRATQLARRMIASWGMDSDFGPVSVDGETGYEWGPNSWSEKTKQDLDDRVQQLLKNHYAQACKILKDHQHLLEQVATALLEKETLDADEFQKIIQNEHNNQDNQEEEQQVQQNK